MVQFKCYSCDRPKGEQFEFCPLCKEETDAYVDDGGPYQHEGLYRYIERTVAAGEQAKRNAEAKGLDMSSPDFWSSMFADLRPDYLPGRG